MKRSINNFLILLLGIFSACNNAEDKHQHLTDPGQHEAIVYTCPMHPEVKSAEPGICPICKMDLELMINEATEQIVSPAKQVLSRQSTVKLKPSTEGKTLEAQGYIDVDRTRNQSVSVRFGGRIEKLYMKYELQYVKKGEKIAALYSPELNTIQEEHLFLLKTQQPKNLIEQSREKLKLMGINDDQISLLEKKGAFVQTINMYSPAEGYVLFNAEMKNNGNTMSSVQTPMNRMEMNEKNNPGENVESSNSRIREGMYINKGETLFNINDLKNVWAIVSVAPETHPAIKKDSEVKIVSELFPDTPVNGKIALVEQTFEDNKQRFVNIRINLPNAKGQLKINSLVTAEIPLETNDNFQLPASAVFYTGLNSFVWVKTGTTKSGTGVFRLRQVVAGPASDGMVMIISGLSANEEVAEQAGYLADSETFLSEN